MRLQPGHTPLRPRCLRVPPHLALAQCALVSAERWPGTWQARES